MRNLKNKLLSNSVFRFLLVGGLSTAADFLIYMLLSLRFPIPPSKAISMIIASLLSYGLNKSFTFQDHRKTSTGILIRFYLVFAANFLTNLAVNALVFGAFQKKLPAFLLATLAGMTVNYLGQRLFVFSGRKDKG